MSTRLFGAVGVWGLAAGIAVGQMVPPVCSAPGTRAATARATHPTQAEIAATAAAGASDASVLVAAEPFENFGVTRYRVQDYAECADGSGCYWADLDAQTVRAEA